MSVARDPLRRVVVAGAGQVGVLAAIALRRALPACEVIVLGLPADPAAFADRSSTALPFTNRLHDRLGVSEDRIVLEAGGSHRLVVRVLGWGGPGHAGTMPYGATLDPALKTGFARDWGAGPRNASGERPPGSLAELLADVGRFAATPPDAETPISDVDYALRWNSHAYRELLIGIAQQLGVAHLPGRIAAIEPDGAGGIAALAIEGQGRLAADLFVDCSGPAALLHSSLPGWTEHDWRGELPVRQVFVARPGEPMIALEDRISLLREGWLTELAGRDALQVALGVGAGMPQGAAIHALQAEPDYIVSVAPGCAAAPWLANVVALGDAAARFEPLGHLNLDLAHRQLDLLLEVLPGCTIEPRERAEFNRRASLMAVAVRDTLGAFYAASAAEGVFGVPRPSGDLSVALDQFVRRGRVPFREEAPLPGQEFDALLGALGFDRGVAPQSRATDRSTIDAARQAFDVRAHAALHYAPPYAQWLESILGA